MNLARTACSPPDQPHRVRCVEPKGARAIPESTCRSLWNSEKWELWPTFVKPITSSASLASPSLTPTPGWLRCSMWLTNIGLGRTRNIGARVALRADPQRIAFMTFWEGDVLMSMVHAAPTPALQAGHLRADGNEKSGQRPLQFLFRLTASVARRGRSAVSSGTGACPWGKCALPAGPE